MSRFLLSAVLLALPSAALAQPTATFAGGLLTITGTDGDDFLTVGCAGGMAQLDGVDIAGAACGDVQRIDLDLLGGLNNATLTTLAAFALDPTNPGVLRGGDDLDVLDLDLTDHTEDLTLSIRPPAAAGQPAAARAEHRSEIYVTRVESPEVTDVYAWLLYDGTQYNVVFAPGPGDDAVEIEPGFTARPLEGLTVFGGLGNDTVDLRALSASIMEGLEVAFNGQQGDDVFRAPSVGSWIGWTAGDGTDQFTPGAGPDRVTVFGSDAAPLTVHEIRGFLGTECAYYDFTGGGGILLDGPERVEEVRYFMPPTVGGDVFSEFDCGGVERDLRWGNSGDDLFHARGPAGGGTLVDLDFPAGQMEIFADGFESGDVSAWATSPLRATGTALRNAGGSLWDGITYQDWPSFTDPSTSGPSTVVVRGRPDFPVSIDMGPDGGPGVAGTGGAVDTLRIEPLGLSVDDDGSRIVIGDGVPITYAGVDAVVIGSPTDTPRGPDDAVPALSVFPNPTPGTARIRVDGAGAEALRLAVADVLGREVAVLHDGPVGPAAGEWALPAGLAPGLYAVHARGGAWVLARAVVVTR